jgi:hypothetical protein
MLTFVLATPAIQIRSKIDNPEFIRLSLNTERTIKESKMSEMGQPFSNSLVDASC